MKTHPLTLLAILILLTTNCFAQQVPRQMVVLEIGTGTWCQYCPGAAMGADDLVENGHDVAVIEYHTYDAYTTDQTDARIYDYYGMFAFPTAIFDGVITELSNSQTESLYEVYLPHYEQRIEIMSDFSIAMSFENTGGSNYTAHVNVDMVNPWTGTATLQFVLTESHIPENWQNQEELDFVCRLMFPDANGSVLDFSGGNSLDFDFDFELVEGWLAEHCELVAFVQENDSKEILQGNKISLEWQASSDATLIDLTVDDESIEDFDPDTYYYEYWVPAGTQVPPTIDGIVNHAGATMDVTQATTIPGSAYILVTAEDGTTQLEYEVEIFMESSSDATLMDLTVDATSINGFDPDTYYYEYWVPSGTQVPPTVDGIVNHSGATMDITQASAIPGSANILVTAEDGTTQLEYEVEFFMESSSDATLMDLTVDGTSINGFDPDTYYYEYWVPSGTQVPPTVDGIVNHAGATMDITQATAIPGSASILVTAEDGTTQLEYEVEFFVGLSSDATLSDLTVDGASINGFDPETYYYEFWLPPGTQVPPTIDGTVNHPAASMDITQATAAPGSASILVTAEDGTTQLEYEVEFFVGLSSDATLSDLTVDGASINGFDPETYYYEFWLAPGTQVPPTIDGTVNHPAASMDITQATAAPGSASILVTAEDGTTQLEYEVEFFVGLSNDASLMDLTVDGVSIEGFDPEIYYYEYWAPSGTQIPPSIDGQVNQPGATMDITQATAIPGSASILVTAEDGTTQEEYELEFFVELSSDASLMDLTVDGVSIEGFDPEIYYYEYWVPTGTQVPPTVDGTVNHSAASMDITQASAIPGSASILVTAEDGATQLEYEVEFLMELSSDASLTDLTVDGVSIDGFDPEVYSYEYWVPRGTQVPPTVDAFANHPGATIEITQATAIPDSANILVTAEDGLTQLEYSVSIDFSVGLDKYEIQELLLYPNPASGHLILEQNIAVGNAEIYNQGGQLVKQLKIKGEKTILDVSGFEPGIYFIKVFSDDNVITRKLVIE